MGTERKNDRRFQIDEKISRMICGSPQTKMQFVSFGNYLNKSRPYDMHLYFFTQ